MSGDLDVLDPAMGVVKFRGERLEIKPLTIGKLPKFMRLARPIIEAVVSRDDLPDEDAGLINLIVKLIAEHGEAAVEAMAIVTGKPAAWIEEGSPAEFPALVRGFVAANKALFGQWIAPQAVGPAVPATADGSGPTQSSS